MADKELRKIAAEYRKVVMHSNELKLILQGRYCDMRQKTTHANDPTRIVNVIVYRKIEKNYEDRIYVK